MQCFDRSILSFLQQVKTLGFVDVIGRLPVSPFSFCVEYDCSKFREGDIRLRGFNLPNVGRVEVCYNKAWGLVCVGDWKPKEANVTCNQLGYKNAEARRIDPKELRNLAKTMPASEGGRFQYVVPNEGTRAWLTNINCLGTEKNLSNCQNGQLFRLDGRISTDCSGKNSEVAAVACSGMSYHHEVSSMTRYKSLSMRLPGRFHEKLCGAC